eukprot:6614803-Pyramimonas_sp.AAC.1
MAPRALPRLPGVTQEGPKRRPGRPKRPPRGPQQAPKRPPRDPQETPKRPPRDTQHAPRGSATMPKSLIAQSWPHFGILGGGGCLR